MPLFEYKCSDCGSKFEELVSSDTKVECPKCGSENVTKLLSTFSASGGSSSSSSLPCGQKSCGSGFS
ncbi:MAG: zinc ribbon domain-containing protein [Candidatus Zixiibacteriota bacterium]